MLADANKGHTNLRGAGTTHTTLAQLKGEQ